MARAKTRGSGALRTKGGGGLSAGQKGNMTRGESRLAKAGFKTGGKKGSPTMRQVMAAGRSGGGG